LNVSLDAELNSSCCCRWTSTVAWQAGYAQGIILTGTQIQTIILLMDENYAFPAWHGTLLAFAAILVSYVINVYGVRSLAYWQIPVFAIGTMAYFAYMVPVWISAPKASHTAVWTGFSNTGGWSSMTLAVLVGQLSGISMQTGVDTVCLNLVPVRLISCELTNRRRQHTWPKKSKTPPSPSLAQ
jgi:choline transport protein